ncbi:MAG: DUF4422 domain-containing protein [Bacilli bacterium]|nr:DUF4422 domain-containing protein [Bacilli bacterium]
MEAVKVFVATTKLYDMPKEKIYQPIQVGAALNEELPYLKDNTKNNISIKNPNYCELTALYWIWQNSHIDIEGLTHYRRYFTKGINRLLSEEDIISILSRHDLIIPNRIFFRGINIKEQYGNCHYLKDYILCKEITCDLYPTYADTFNNIEKQNHLRPYNMMITRKDIIDEYAEWLFKILFECEKKIDITNYSDYQKRVFGFLSERLFNVWLEKNKKYNFLNLSITNIENNEYIKKYFYNAK